MPTKKQSCKPKTAKPKLRITVRFRPFRDEAEKRESLRLFVASLTMKKEVAK